MVVGGGKHSQRMTNTIRRATELKKIGVWLQHQINLLPKKQCNIRKPVLSSQPYCITAIMNHRITKHNINHIQKRRSVYSWGLRWKQKPDMIKFTTLTEHCWTNFYRMLLIQQNNIFEEKLRTILAALIWLH